MSAEPTEFDADLDAAVNTFIAESEDSPVTEVVTPKVAPVVVASAKPDEVPDNSPRVSAIAAKLMRREAELVKREAALRDLQSKAPPAEVKPEPKAPNFKLDPVGFFKFHGMDPADTARVILAKELGDKVPEQYRSIADKFSEKAQVADQLEQLRAELAKTKAEITGFTANQLAQAKATQAFQEVQSEINAAVVDPKYAYAAELFTNKPDFFKKEVLREIMSDARSRYDSEGPGAQAIKAPEAIRRINERLEQYGFTLKTNVGTQPPKKNVGALLQTRNQKHVEEEGDSFDDIQALAMKEFVEQGRG